MKLAFADLCSIKYCVAVLDERVQYGAARRLLRLTAAIPSNEPLESRSKSEAK
jgi:hypothetical protein